MDITLIFYNIMKGIFYLLFLSVLICRTASCETINSPDSGEMSLLAINVGKADCLLLRSGDSAYLIDTGTKKMADQVLEVLDSCGVDHLNGIILTHTHDDHTGGLKKIIESGIPVDAVYSSAYYVLKKEEGKHPVEKALKKTDMTVVWLKAGDEIMLDGGRLTVLGPVEKSDVENNNSLALLAEGGGGSMLLTGDMEFPEEQTLLQAGLLSPVNVITIGNHGEGDATSEALIAAVTPSLAVISTNTKEEPDTPDPRVMKLLERNQISVVQTQETDTGVLITIKDGEVTTEYE